MPTGGAGGPLRRGHLRREVTTSGDAPVPPEETALGYVPVVSVRSLPVPLSPWHLTPYEVVSRSRPQRGIGHRGASPAPLLVRPCTPPRSFGCEPWAPSWDCGRYWKAAWISYSVAAWETMRSSSPGWSRISDARTVGWPSRMTVAMTLPAGNMNSARARPVAQDCGVMAVSFRATVSVAPVASSMREMRGVAVGDCGVDAPVLVGERGERRGSRRRRRTWSAAGR